MKQQLDIDIESLVLPGILSLPEVTNSLVIFAHGSGSSRLSPRNGYVADVLKDAGIGTLLFDLLTEEEDLLYENRFDIGLIAARLVAVTSWLRQREDTGGLAFGYFGASTGAAAALQAAAQPDVDIRAIVSRGGRPDLAMDYLGGVSAPTLLIVGGEDYQVIEMNQRAYERLPGTRRMELVAGATHLFEESGTLEEAARLARDWFLAYLGRGSTTDAGGG